MFKGKNKIRMSININKKSYYSLLESRLSTDEINYFAVQNSQKHVFITVSNFYGTIVFYNKSIEIGLITIIGLDIFYLNNKLLIFPTSNEGYKNLIKISSNKTLTSIVAKPALLVESVL